MEKIMVDVNDKFEFNMDICKDIDVEIIPNRIIFFTQNDNRDKLIYEVSYILSEYIIEKYEVILLSNIIISNYSHLKKSERNRIVEIAQNIIEGEENLIDKMFCIRRKNYIFRQLMDYLSCENKVILEGFIEFRLKVYKKELEKIIKQAMDIYVAETEYNEFVNLLKYFVNIQDSKIDDVYVVHDEGSYKLYDKLNNDISYLYIEEMQEEIISGDLSNEDILLGALITISPKKIIIKKEAKKVLDSEILNTIINVFDDRITIE